MTPRTIAAALTILAAVGLTWTAAPAARAQNPGTTVRPTGVLVEPERYDAPPPGRRLAAREVLRTAEAIPEVRRERQRNPRSYARVYIAKNGQWQFSLFEPPEEGSFERAEIAQVLVDDRSGRATEVWTGVQVEWPMARGYPGAFGRSANAPWVWVGLCVLFVLPFLRPPLRLLHLDLAVLLAFSVSYAFFGAAKLAISVPSAYPLLGYLLARMLVVASRPRRPPPRLLVGSGFLLIGIVFLVGFRVVLNVVDGNVIDVGYSGVIGADHLVSGGPLYGAFPADDPRGDTYGPVAYAAYVPFESIWPWRGVWDDLPAAHAAALVFDLGSALLLFLLGRRLRGRQLGLLLAYLWMTYPFTLLVANSSANDSLVTVLVLAALLFAARPVVRGALVALAALTKFAPLALAPLFATFGTSRSSIRPRSRLATTAMTLAAVVVVTALILAPVDLDVFWRRTLGFQQDRDSPFSIWGYYDLPATLQAAAQACAALLAVVVAFVPRTRDVATLSALAGAVLIALQLTVDHWFYLYLVWFAPLVWVALLTPESDEGSARSSQRGLAASTG
jgi:Glycosyltransferase family 87